MASPFSAYCSPAVLVDRLNETQVASRMSTRGLEKIHDAKAVYLLPNTFHEVSATGLEVCTIEQSPAKLGVAWMSKAFMAWAMGL